MPFYLNTNAEYLCSIYNSYYDTRKLPVWNKMPVFQILLAG